jgi:transposase
MADLSKVELYAAIRRDSRAGVSGRALQSKYRVGWRTVRKALTGPWPEPRKKYPPRPSKLDPFKGVIDEILVADLDAPRKQRHTVRRIYARLLDEHMMADVSYQVVRAYVALRRPQIRVEHGREPVNAFIPQSHRPGMEAEVDFGEVAVRLAGELVTCHLFCLRMSYSGKAVHRISASGGQEAFFEGHAHAFSVLGGVPAGKVRYDNLKAAVAKVLGFSRLRVESDRMNNGDTVSPRSLRINAYQVSETTQVSLAYSSTGLPHGLSFCPIGVPQRTQFMLLLPVSFSEPRWQPDVSVRWSA